jgi:hypothetical protein
MTRTSYVPEKTLSMALAMSAASSRWASRACTLSAAPVLLPVAVCSCKIARTWKADGKRRRSASRRSVQWTGRGRARRETARAGKHKRRGVEPHANAPDC